MPQSIEHALWLLFFILPFAFITLGLVFLFGAIKYPHKRKIFLFVAFLLIGIGAWRGMFTEIKGQTHIEDNN